MWYNALYFQTFLTIYKIHHVEIVDNGLLTYEQDGKSCRILLETNDKNFMCNWQLSEKSVFDRHFDSLETSLGEWRQKGYKLEDYIEAKFDIAKYASNPRQYMYWLENVGPNSHGIFNVSCVIWTDKVRNVIKDVS